MHRQVIGCLWHRRMEKLDDGMTTLDGMPQALCACGTCADATVSNRCVHVCTFASAGLARRGVCGRTKAAMTRMSCPDSRVANDSNFGLQVVRLRAVWLCRWPLKRRKNGGLVHLWTRIALHMRTFRSQPTNVQPLTHTSITDAFILSCSRYAEQCPRWTVLWLVSRKVALIRVRFVEAWIPCISCMGLDLANTLLQSGSATVIT